MKYKPFSTDCVWWLFHRNMKAECNYYLGGNNPYLTSKRLDDKDCAALCASFAENPCVVKLDLRYNNITSDGAKDLGLLIQVHKKAVWESHSTVRQN